MDAPSMIILTLIILDLATGNSACPSTDFAYPLPNDTFCDGGVGQAKGIDTAEACKQLCCQNATCGFWQFCDNTTSGSKGCGEWAGHYCFTGVLTDCQRQGQHKGWTGASRSAVPSPTPPPMPPPPPTPPPPPRKDWNLQPNLVPPGVDTMWRGATLQEDVGHGVSLYGGIGQFHKDFGARLHLYRGFYTGKRVAATPDEEQFVRAGGILFYSVEPNCWSCMAWAKEGSDDYAQIAAWAGAVGALAPHKVFVAPGYEPDGHANESQPHKSMVFGTANEYRLMFRNFRKIFAARNVTNAVFALDLSMSISTNGFVLPLLWPGDDAVDWVFWNIFSSQPTIGHPDEQHQMKGNCSLVARSIYEQLEANATAGLSYTSKPWGIGAWGAMNATFGDPPKWPSKAIPAADRAECLAGMQRMFEDRVRYPRLRSSTYFNSLNSLICPRAVPGYASSSELVPNLTALVHSKVFTALD
eukprot:g2196.t1